MFHGLAGRWKTRTVEDRQPDTLVFGRRPDVLPDSGMGENEKRQLGGITVPA